MIWNGLITGSIKSIIADSPKNLDLGKVTRSIVDDCIRVPKPDWEDLVEIILEKLKKARKSDQII